MAPGTWHGPGRGEERLGDWFREWITTGGDLAERTRALYLRLLGTWIDAEVPVGSGGGAAAGGRVRTVRLGARTLAAERDAYELALWGPVTEVGADGAIGRDGGCSMIPYEPRGADAAWLLGVQEEATAFLDTLDQDSRLGEVNAAWASCMADAGFTERSPEAAEQRLWDDQRALVADGTWPENDVVWQRGDDEHRLAVADMDCREATDWTAQHRAIELALQQEYVDAHLADLEALVAALTAPAS